MGGGGGNSVHSYCDFTEKTLVRAAFLLVGYTNCARMFDVFGTRARGRKRSCL